MVGTGEALRSHHRLDQVIHGAFLPRIFEHCR
jgi:hypothetical protein